MTIFVLLILSAEDRTFDSKVGVFRIYRRYHTIDGRYLRARHQIQGGISYEEIEIQAHWVLRTDQKK